MKNFLCWNAESTAIIALGTVEFGEHRDVVDRCHIPVMLEEGERESGEVRGDRPQVEESKLLTNFLSEQGHSTTYAVIGKSGFGKTHLMNWLHSRILEESTADKAARRRRLHLIPRKRTSVPDIVEMLLEGLDLGEADQGLKKVRLGIEALRKESGLDLRLRFLNKMSEFLDSDAKNEAASKRRQRIAEVLFDFIRERSVEAFLREDDGKIAQIVRRLQGTDHGADDEMDTIAWLEGSLEIPESVLQAADSKIVSRARNLLRGPSKQEVLGVLNDASSQAYSGLLEDAVQVNASTAMELIRQKWHEQEGDDFEIVLILEDLARTENVENTLVKAWVESEAEPGDSVPMRTIFAATDGVYQKLDLSTRTRMTSVFVLQDVLGNGGDSPQALEFTTQYLKEIRDRSGFTCGACEWRSECHSAFGEVDGTGLYPLTKVTLRESADLAKNEDGRIPPRGFIQDVIARALTAGANDIPSGAHPGADFPSRRGQDYVQESLAIFNMGSQAGVDAATRERGVKAVLAYGEIASDGGFELAGGISSVLDLNWLAGTRVHEPVVDPEPERTIPDRRDPFLEVINAWAAGEGGLDGPANEALRKAVRRVGLSSLSPDVHWIPKRFSESDLWGIKSFDFEDSGRMESSSWFRCRLPLGNGSADTVLERRSPILLAHDWVSRLQGGAASPLSLGAPASVREGVTDLADRYVELAALQEEIEQDLKVQVGQFFSGGLGVASLDIASAMIQAGDDLPRSGDWRHGLEWSKGHLASAGLLQQAVSDGLSIVSARKGVGGPLIVNLADWMEAWSDVVVNLQTSLQVEIPRTSGTGLLRELRELKRGMEGFESTMRGRLTDAKVRREGCLSRVTHYLGDDFGDADGYEFKKALRAYVKALQDCEGVISEYRELGDRIDDLIEWIPHLRVDSAPTEEWPLLLPEMDALEAVQGLNEILDGIEGLSQSVDNLLEGKGEANRDGNPLAQATEARLGLVRDLEYILGLEVSKE